MAHRTAQPPRKTFRTMSIGGATYDLFVRTDHSIIQTCNTTPSFTLPLGEKIRVREVIETCGGGASNTSVGLARLGAQASFAGVIGSDQWGQKLLENLKNEHVQTDCITIVEEEVSSFSIILSASSGERVILYTPGTNEHLHDATFDREKALRMDWIYLNHISEESCVIQDDIVAILTTPHAPHLTWNPGGCQIDKGIHEPHVALLLSHTDLLLLNHEEALKFTQEQNDKAALGALLKKGVHAICITNGKEGVTATDGSELYHCPILPQETIDTTGAGDAFGTGATWALLSGFDLPRALRAGTINAASVVGAFGAQAGLLTDIEMQERLQSTSLDVANRQFS
ncbi:hypothetical protein A2635_01580 [Candidatus Peribacteria bacterium RIFCSPHIGHO2_01_FULL_51_9]|nr:MAG: hypothetical protein A2635_01580 [Candidatus Peribacteria bacterium RIFCSPHIGHO2_01_FULL_51_9]